MKRAAIQPRATEAAPPKLTPEAAPGEVGVVEVAEEQCSSPFVGPECRERCQRVAGGLNRDLARRPAARHSGGSVAGSVRTR